MRLEGTFAVGNYYLGKGGSSVVMLQMQTSRLTGLKQPL